LPSGPASEKLADPVVLTLIANATQAAIKEKAAELGEQMFPAYQLHHALIMWKSAKGKSASNT